MKINSRKMLELLFRSSNALATGLNYYIKFDGFRIRRGSLIFLRLHIQIQFFMSSIQAPPHLSSASCLGLAMLDLVPLK